jgi:hypothetical protein
MRTNISEWKASLVADRDSVIKKLKAVSNDVHIEREVDGQVYLVDSTTLEIPK